MNFEIEVLEIDNKAFSVLVPLIEDKKKADRVLKDVEIYLTIFEHRVNANWSEVKRDGVWYTKLLFKFHEPPLGAERMIKFAFKQFL